ncbi:NHL repeat-containing protein [Desulfurobacterium sp.]|uniref:NHL repeat-containing protein n=1 Tax=Desulfurobacterium sp. TaxID=2004706 RepID=UPI00261093A5|nr:NHL repeat-containing protein [Desulfurobacterium sp.]
MRFLIAVLLAVFSFSVPSFAGQISGNFKFPSDIAVSAGKIYVVDGLNGRIVVLNKNGDEVGTIKADNPYGISVDGSGIYVASQSGKVLIFSKDGKLKKSIDVSGRPIDVVRVGNNLWITDGKNNCVKIVSIKSGKVIKQIGEKGSVPGDFVSPFMIATDGKNVYVVDSINARVEVFDKNGNFLRVFGDFGVEEGDFYRPKGIAVFNGEVAVSDVVNGAVQLFNPYGAFDGVVAKGLQYPISIAYDAGVLYVLEPLKNKILTFNVQGVK